jgi:hypothetical protein
MLTLPLKKRDACFNEFNELMWYFQVKMNYEYKLTTSERGAKNGNY